MSVGHFLVLIYTFTLVLFDTGLQGFGVYGVFFRYFSIFSIQGSGVYGLVPKYVTYPASDLLFSDLASLSHGSAITIFGKKIVVAGPSDSKWRRFHIQARLRNLPVNQYRKIPHKPHYPVSKKSKSIEKYPINPTTLYRKNRKVK